MSESTPISVLLLFFAEIITLLVVEMNRYYHQFLENSDEGPSLEREVTEVEMFAFLALILQMGHTRCGNKETGLLLLLISGHVDDEEEGRALTHGLPSTVTQRFIHAHRLVWL